MSKAELYAVVSSFILAEHSDWQWGDDFDEFEECLDCCDGIKKVGEIDISQHRWYISSIVVYELKGTDVIFGCDHFNTTGDDGGCDTDDKKASESIYMISKKKVESYEYSITKGEE